MTLIVHIGVLLKLCKFREDIGSLNGQDVQDKCVRESAKTCANDAVTCLTSLKFTRRSEAERILNNDSNFIVFHSYGPS